jgi:hypothetical protein
MQGAINLFFFPHDGHYWRIDWLGDVKYRISVGRNSTPSIQVSLSQWSDANLDADRICNVTSPHQRQVYAPVGFMGILKIGDVWRNGELVSSPQYQTERFTDVSVEKDTTITIKAGLGTKVASSEVFYLPLSVHPYHIGNTGSYCLLVKLPDGKRLIIPASELISFYFGSSSTLINALFHVPLTEKSLWKSAEYGRGKESKIVLAPGIFGWSASDIARMAFSRPALLAAQLVGDSLAAACAYHLELYPKTRFPFYGKTTLEASGVWLPFGNSPNRTFLVFKLLSCSHPFPFNKLEYELSGCLANTANYTKMDKYTKPIGADPLIIPAKRISKNHVEEDPSKNIATVELTIETRTHFTDLLYKSVRRVEEPDPVEVEIQLSPGKSISSASTGTGGIADDIRPVDLVQQSEWGEQGSKTYPFMRELVDDLSASELYEKVEMIPVSLEDKNKILSSFDEALRQYELEQLDQPSRKRLDSLSNIQIAVVIYGRVKIYLLIAETGHPSKLTHLCATAIPASTTSTLSATQEVEAALDAQGHCKAEDEHGKITQYFMHLPDIALKSDISTAVQYVSRHMELYGDIFQSSVI